MQEITQKMKRYLIELIKIFAITEVVVVIAYFLVVVTGFNIISLSELLLMVAKFYCIGLLIIHLFCILTVSFGALIAVVLIIIIKLTEKE